MTSNAHRNIVQKYVKNNVQMCVRPATHNAVFFFIGIG